MSRRKAFVADGNLISWVGKLPLSLNISHK